MENIDLEKVLVEEKDSEFQKEKTEEKIQLDREDLVEKDVKEELKDQE